MYRVSERHAPPPAQLHAHLTQKLNNYQRLLTRTDTPVVTNSSAHADLWRISSRELALARSMTTLATLLRERQQYAETSAPPAATSTHAVFFEHPELLEHILSFVPNAAALATAGAVCIPFYLASRMHTLWEKLLQKSGYLVGIDKSLLPTPYEEDYTLFETARRIAEHGCRPLAAATPPLRGSIDSHVDDLAAYEFVPEEGGATDDVGAPAATAANPPAPPPATETGATARSVSYSASHAVHGAVKICSLPPHHARTVRYLSDCSPSLAQWEHALPLATSPHLQPLLQVILPAEQPTAYIVTPRYSQPLSGLLPLTLDESHRVFAQLAHAVGALHAQGFAHGNITLRNVLVKETDRPPYVALGLLHMCQRFKKRSREQQASDSGAASSSSGSGAAASSSRASDATPGGPADAVPPPPPVPGMLRRHMRLHGPHLFRFERDHPYDRRSRRLFASILLWAWGCYERDLGLVSGYFDPSMEMERDAPAALTSEVKLCSADVIDLGRLLLRLVLEPFVREVLRTHAATNPPVAVNGQPPQQPHAVHHIAGPPPESQFQPEFRDLIEQIFSGSPPTAAEIARHPWVLRRSATKMRPLCDCWQLSAAGVAGPKTVASSDLRLLRRTNPSFEEVSLAGCAAVNDKWLEALSLHHAETLRRLDLSGCYGLSATAAPLRSLANCTNLEVLHLPAEHWGEHELADLLASLPKLRKIDESSHRDVRKARSDILKQLSILSPLKAYGAGAVAPTDGFHLR